MGTKFEYASDWLVNSVISSHNSGNRRTKSLSFNCVNDWGKPRKKELIAERRMEKTGAHRLQREDQAGDQMDKSEDTQNMESIRKTMQMHEDVFKQQVRELHRLYSVQKTLMGEVKKQIEQSRVWSPQTTATSTMTNMNSIYMSHQAFPCPGNHPSSRNFDLGRPIKGDVSSHGRELGDGCSMEEHEVELSLSIGGKMSGVKPKTEVEKKFVSSPSHESDRSGPAAENSASTEACDRKKKWPHWLFHV